jgi:hypothetical protein
MAGLGRASSLGRAGDAGAFPRRGDPEIRPGDQLHGAHRGRDPLGDRHLPGHRTSRHRPAPHHDPDQHVPARRTVPPAREPALPLGVCPQRGGRPGAVAIPRLLPDERHRRGGSADAPVPRPGRPAHAHGRGERRHRRRHGCLRRLLPAGARPHRGADLRLHPLHLPAGRVLHRPLVRPADDLRLRGRVGLWRGLLRPHRRVRLRVAGHEGAGARPDALGQKSGSCPPRGRSRPRCA